MEFKEFKEFDNPESTDYDIKSSLKDANSDNYSEKIIELIGIIEDVDYISDEEFMNQYGILKYEYFNPTADTVRKVEAKIASIKQNKTM